MAKSADESAARVYAAFLRGERAHLRDWRLIRTAMACDEKGLVLLARSVHRVRVRLQRHDTHPRLTRALVACECRARRLGARRISEQARVIRACARWSSGADRSAHVPLAGLRRAVLSGRFDRLWAVCSAMTWAGFEAGRARGAIFKTGHPASWRAPL